MGNKILIVNSVIIIILAIALNFNAMLMGSTASILNVIVTTCYLVFWITFTALVRKHKEMLLYGMVISAISFAVSLITLAINIFDWSVSIAIPLVAIFLTPLYGIRVVFIDGFILPTITMSVICGIWLISSITLYKRTK